MNSLDPSYLRYIYDGIFNDVIASDNESTLPDGLVGLYEDAFLENITVYRRQQSLEVFACWALLKKEASILFVSEILQVDETEIFELVGTYSSWFNSPESGKYSLYHERLRIYFLQKLGEKEVQRLNQRLIARLQKAISDQNKDEFEIYALQFLSDHLIVEAFADETKGKQLLDFTKNELIWNRQIKISNQFTWTKNTIQNTILWTSKYQPKESVFGYLDLVELHHKEQNDAENIVAIVANNEIELVLKRIESFGGTDKEGLQRKFTLYMLCLMELTLLESKTQPWRKEAVEKILKHFDEQIPIDHSILNWDIFFSSALVFQLSCELKMLGLEFIQIYKRTNDWDTDWLKVKGTYNSFEIDVILAISTSNFITQSNLFVVASELIDQNEIESAILISNQINDNELKSNILNIIARKYYNQGKLLKSIKCLKLSPSEKSNKRTLLYISLKIKITSFLWLIFSKYGIKLFLYFVLNKLFSKRKNDIIKNFEIVNSLIKHNKRNWRHSQNDEIKEFAETFELEKFNIYTQYLNDNDKCRALGKIALEMSKMNKIEANNVLLTAILKSQQITRKFDRDKSFKDLSSLYSEINKVKEVYHILNFSIEFIKGINEAQKLNGLNNISIKLVKNGFLTESIKCAQGIPDSVCKLKNVNIKRMTFYYLAKELINHKWEDFIYSCNDYLESTILMVYLSSALAEKGEITESEFAIKEAYVFANSIIEESDRESIKFDISNELINQGKIKEAFQYVEDRSDLDNIIINIISKLVELGKIDDALTYKSKFSCEDSFMEYLVDAVAKNLNLSDTLEYLKLISDDKRDSVLSTLGFQLIDKGKVDESYECVNLITNVYYKDNLLERIGSFLAKNGRVDEAKTYLNNFYENYGYNKCNLMQEIALQLVNQNKIQEAIDYSKEINYMDFYDNLDNSHQVRVLQDIALYHVKNGDWKLSESIVSEIIKIDDILFCLKNISLTLIKDKGVLYSLESHSNYQNKEFQKYYLKGWAENIGLNELTEEILLKALPLFKNDQDSLNHLLQTHAINELFFGETSTDEIQKYNRTLNIQWAMDIKHQIDSNS
jgi:hypothetical protein